MKNNRELTGIFLSTEKMVFTKACRAIKFVSGARYDTGPFYQNLVPGMTLGFEEPGQTGGGNRPDMLPRHGEPGKNKERI